MIRLLFALALFVVLLLTHADYILSLIPLAVVVTGFAHVLPARRPTWSPEMQREYDLRIAQLQAKRDWRSLF